MAYAQDGAFRSYDSDADLSAEGSGQYRCVRRTATGFALVGAANAANVLGILQDNPRLGEGGTIKVRDVSKAVIGAAVAVDALLTTDAQSRLVTATTGQNVVARALEAGGTVNQLISVELAGVRSTAP